MENNNWFIHIFSGGSALGGILCGKNYKGAKGYSILILGGILSHIQPPFATLHNIVRF